MKKTPGHRRVVQLSPNGMLILAGSIIAFANPAFARMIGAKSPEELHGRNALDFFHRRYRKQTKDAFQKAADGGEKNPPIEQQMIRLDGSVTDVELTVFPLTYHGMVAAMVVVEDIARRKNKDDSPEPLTL